MPGSGRRTSGDLFPALPSKCFGGGGGGNVKSEDEFLKSFRIPDYILGTSSQSVEISTSAPECPVIVFINSSSGGQRGGYLLETYRGLLNRAQVFDLRKEAPDKVLHKLYGNLEKLKSSGDVVAAEIQKRLKLIVAGGDGTASWLLGVVCDLKLAHPPPVATVPLGTGNNLPFSFGWGRKNPGTDPQSVKSFLAQVLKAKEMKIDSWHITMRMKAPKEISCNLIAPLELPPSLHAFHHVSNLEGSIEEDVHTFRGGFWNYFSLGMDAQVSYAFHSERKLHPNKFKNQISNQYTYARLACTQGWFCASIFHPTSRNLAHLARIKIMNKHGSWRDLKIPSSVRSIVCLNLPSFSGGLNPWGTPNERKARDRELTPPFVDDGLLEVVGFKDGWHGFVLLTPNGHGTRLAQAHGIRFEFRKGTADHVYMRLDGEPWKQPLPTDDDTVLVEISSLGQVKIMATQECKARSVSDFSPSISGYSLDDDMDSCEDRDGGSGESRKFGAADTFRFPDDVHGSRIV